MADLLKFPSRNQLPRQAYELHRYCDDTGIRTTIAIAAVDQADAKQQARLLSESLRSELWSKGRLIETLAAGDHPIAGAISLL